MARPLNNANTVKGLQDRMKRTGLMSSKRRRFHRRGVDPGLALIIGIAVGTALVLLLASWWW
jgi:hypothetical protein